MLSATIDVHSAGSISQFGRKLGERAAGYADALLDKASARDFDETGAQLNQIVLRAKEFDIDSMNDPFGRIPVVGGLLKSLIMSKERTVARFDSVKDQVDAMVSTVENTASMFKTRNTTYQRMYDGVKREHADLGLHIAAIEKAIARVAEELSELGDPDGDFKKSETIATLKAGRLAMTKRRDDLVVLKHSAMQMMPMVRVIQYNNLSLTDKFETIQTLAPPAWKRTFLMWLALSEQKESVELANSIDEATNHFMRANADLLHQNSVATARSSQNLVIDIETLKHVHNKIIDTVNDVRIAHEEGAAKRVAALRE